MEIFITAVAVFLLVGSIIFSIMSPKVKIEEEAIQRRLGAIAAKAERPAGRVRLLEQGDTIWEKILRLFLGEKELPEKYKGVRVILHQAGYPGERAVRVFWGARLFTTAAFAAAGFLYALILATTFGNLLVLSFAGAALGYLAPIFLIKRKARFRVQKIRETLPDTLDLLVVCVEAGLGIDAALLRVGKEQSEQGLIIGGELQLMGQEVRAGVMRREALARLAERLAIDELQGLVTFLNQTEEVGGSIARSLRVYASTMRDKRSQRAEEAARKTVIKLIFPLVMFIMPALFIIVLGPAILNIIKLLGSAF
jgi:tight adherence protein C